MVVSGVQAHPHPWGFRVREGMHAEFRRAVHA